MTARESKGPRLFVSNVRFSIAASVGSSITLSADDSHYIANVLRLHVQDLIEIGDGESGTIARARVTNIADVVTVTIEELLSPDTSQLPRFTLLCSLCKGQKNDLICDWATELGCSEIVFWQAARSVVRLSDQRECQHKEARLSKIALAAAQQSKQSRPPVVRVTRSLTDALHTMSLTPEPGELRIVCSLSTESRPLAEIISHPQPTSNITLAIGPEGDLTPEEEELLISRGFRRASLGTQILRSELAVVSALTRIRMQ
jgi:16S rRNA (uracil1498-N3)-methyltransferase